MPGVQTLLMCYFKISPVIMETEYRCPLFTLEETKLNYITWSKSGVERGSFRTQECFSSRFPLRVHLTFCLTFTISMTGSVTFKAKTLKIYLNATEWNLGFRQVHLSSPHKGPWLLSCRRNLDPNHQGLRGAWVRTWKSSNTVPRNIEHQLIHSYICVYLRWDFE